MSGTFDVIVVGGGVMGTAAARALAQRGRETLLLERFRFGHKLGSSGGPTRIFRFTYEHPDYVRMAGPALDAWRELEDAAGETLLSTTGGIDIGEGARQSADALAAAGAPFAWIAAEAAVERWQGLSIDTGTPVLFQEQGSVCFAERTVKAQARLAAEAGVTVLEETKAERIAPAGDAAWVHTEGESFRAPVVVATAGPWAGPLLATAGLHLPLVPSFEQVSYFRLREPSPLPTVVDWTGASTRELAGGSVHVPYAVPDPEEPGAVKVALDRSGPDVDAETRPFDPDPVRLASVGAWAASRFAPLEPDRPPETCLYTNTPDGEFVIDRVGPIVVGSPCSGHGFKFGPLIGRILADLATGETPPVPLVAFAATRAFVRRHLSERPFE